MVEILEGDCLELMRGLADNSVDAVVTDPPYGLEFMGKIWDKGVPAVPFWAEMLRILKPGGHLLAFSGSRTYHRMAVAIEDAGFEIRDQIMWVYGSGFPKSLDVSKAIDKAEGAEREIIGHTKNARPNRIGKETKLSGLQTIGGEITEPQTDAAKQWEGWGTALKPSHEPLVLARKPLSEKNVAANVLKWGTGAINVDGCRINGKPPAPRNAPKKVIRGGRFHAAANAKKEMSHYNPTQGRWPANLIHDGSDEVVGLFPQSKSTGGQASLGAFRNGDIYGKGRDEHEQRDPGYGDSGSAARFFYCAKASKTERNGSKHPTVKPLSLMRYLVRLIAPPGGTVLDPFAGSGTTGHAAELEGMSAILIEREAEYVSTIKQRLSQLSIAI